MIVLIYDTEIRNCIPPRKGHLDPDYTYCDGWDDHAGMGLAALCGIMLKGIKPIGTEKNALSFIDQIRGAEYFSAVYHNDKRRNYTTDKLITQMLNCTDVLVGFNNFKHDDPLMEANGFTLPRRRVDILREIYNSAGLDPNAWHWKTHSGYSLNQLCKDLDLPTKIASGEDAPKLWQDGDYTTLLTYCMNDVARTFNIAETFLFPETEKRPEICVPFWPIREF